MYTCHTDIDIPTHHQQELRKHLFLLDQRLQKIVFSDEDPRILRYSYLSGMPPASLDVELRRVAASVIETLNAIPIQVTYQNMADIPGCAHPYEDLVRRGWVIATGSGNHLYKGLMSELFHALDFHFQAIARLLHAEAYKFPTLINLRHLMRTGYLDNFPHNANFVSHLPEQLTTIQKFKDAGSGGIELSGEQSEYLLQPDQILSPTVCYHFYASHHEKVLAADLVGATALSPCYRFEGRASQGMYRLREFNMREILFLGNEALVLGKRAALLRQATQVLDLFGLKSKLQTASDPFFLSDKDNKRRYLQSGMSLKHEMLAYLPDIKEWLAVGSVNYHQNHFGHSFNITSQNGDSAFSCCLGFGIDRFCAAIFAQYGTHESDWPATLQSVLENYRNAFEVEPML